MSKRGWKPVDMKYMGQPIGNAQDPDEPYDHSAGTRTADGMKIGGKGSQGGGSKATPQARRPGSASNRGSYPRQTQKIRG